MFDKVKHVGVAWLLALILICMTLLYLGTMSRASFGFYHDDGIYVTLAKALATGQGYRVISLPGEPVDVKSPPVYPFLLSLIWRVKPQFPQNLTGLAMLSVVAGLTTIILAFFYFTRRGYLADRQALLVVGLVAVNWWALKLATTMHSELLYTALSIAALYLAESHQSERWRPTGLLVGLFSGVAFLTRPAGLALIVAVLAYYFVQGRLRMGFLFLATAGTFVFGWAVWGYVHKPMAVGYNTAYYESYFATLAGVVNEIRLGNDSSHLMAFLTIIGRNGLSLVFWVPMVCLGINPEWVRGLAPGYVMVFLGLALFTFALISKSLVGYQRTGRLVPLYIIAYLALHLMWPYSTYHRFLVPVLPLLLLLLISELGILTRSIIKEGRPGTGMAEKLSAYVVALVLLGLISIPVCGCYAGIKRSLFGEKRSYEFLRSEDAETMNWVEAHCSSSEVILCDRDSSYYLFTGRKASRYYPLSQGARRGSERPNDNEIAEVFFRIVAENRARYLILTARDLEVESESGYYGKGFEQLIERESETFVPVFRTSDGLGVVYELHIVGG